MTAREAEAGRQTRYTSTPAKLDYGVKHWVWGYRVVKNAACAQYAADGGPMRTVG